MDDVPPVCILQPDSRSLFAGSTAGVILAPQQLQPLAHEQQQQHTSVWQHLDATQQQLKPRPVHVPGQLQQLVDVLRSCSDLQQLQHIVVARLTTLPAGVLTVAMLQVLTLQQQQQSRSRGMRQLQSGLVKQLSEAMVQQLPAASWQTLTVFLAAAAAGQMMLPEHALELMAQELVHRALRGACQERQQQRQGAGSLISTASVVQDASKMQPVSQVHPGAIRRLRSHSAEQQTMATAAQALVQQQQQHPISKSAWALARLQLHAPTVWAELGSLAGEYLQQLTAQDIVLVSWALAKSHQHQPRLFNALQHQLKGEVHRLTPDAISCLLWSYATVGHYHHAGTAALVTAAAGSMERFTPRALTRTLWACAKLRHFDPRLLSALRVQALASMGEFEPQNLSMLMWGLATFGVVDMQLAQAVAQRASSVIQGFTMQGLTNLAWGLAKMQQLQHKQSQQQRPRSSSSRCRKQSKQTSSKQDFDVDQLQQFMATIATTAVSRLPTAKPQEVCNLMWACAVLRYKHSELLTAACARLCVVAGDITPQDFSQAMWALGVFKYNCRHTLQVINRHALNKLNQFGPQALSNWCWAVAVLRPQLTSATKAAAAHQCQVLLPRFTPQGLATTLWALSKLGGVSQQLLHDASYHILANIGCYNAQDICNISMVCAKAGYREPTLLQGLADAASSAAAVTLMLHNSSSAISSGSGSAQHALDSSRQPVSCALGGSSSSHHPQLQQQSYQKLRLAAASAVRQKQLTVQGVGNLVWAFAGLGWYEPVLLKQLQQLAAHFILEGCVKTGDIAGLVQGFALLGESCDVLLQALERSTVWGLHPFRQAGPSSSAVNQKPHLHSETHSSRTTNTAEQRQRQQAHWRRQLRRWSPDALALLVWGIVASACHEHHARLLCTVLEVLQAAGVSRLSETRRAELHLAITLLATQWGLVHWPADGGFSWTQPCSCSHVESSNTGASSAARAGHQQPCDVSDSAPPGVYLLPAGVSHATAVTVLCGRLAQHCSTGWQHVEAATTLTSIEEQVLQVLQSMGLTPMAQRWIQPSHQCQSVGSGGAGQAAAVPVSHWSIHGLRVSIAVSGACLGDGQQPVAIEVLPARFISSSWPVRVLGRHSLKHQCLQAAGWRVLVITADQWESIGVRKEQQEFLKQVIWEDGNQT